VVPTPELTNKLILSFASLIRSIITFIFINLNQKLNLFFLQKIGENLCFNHGWSMVIGEHIKNWRARYFLLYEDGSLIGFRKEPDSAEALADPLNNFTVKGCQIMATDRPKPYTFLIRGLHLSTVERTFHVETEQERFVLLELLVNNGLFHGYEFTESDFA